MYLKGFALFFGACTASVVDYRPIVQPRNMTANPSLPKLNSTMEDAHINILANFPADQIIYSTGLDMYFANNAGKNHTIYVQDTKKFISMASVSPLSKRGDGPFCHSYQHVWVPQSGHWYTNWRPAESNPRCLYTGDSESGGSLTIDVSFIFSISESISLEWNVIKYVLGATVGLTITESWSKATHVQCSVSKNRVVQVWFEPLVAWGWFWGENCQSCGKFGTSCSSGYVIGGQTTPVDQYYNSGCTTGYDKVQC